MRCINASQQQVLIKLKRCLGGRITKHKLEDLIDIDHFQHLQDKLNEIYPFPSAIVDNEGKILTATAWEDICTKFHRQNEETEKLCIQSDLYIKEHLHEADPFISYKCAHGLIDNAAPIIVDGVHYANFLIGQIFLEEPDLDFFREQAQKYGFDEEDYIEAVKKVSIWSEEQRDSYIHFVKGLITVITETALQRVNEIESKKQIQENQQRLQSILETSMDGFCLTDKIGDIIEVNDSYCNMTGYSKDELTLMNISDLENSEKACSQDFVRFESKHRRKDGTFFDVEVSVHFHENNGGQCALFIRDITERKLAENALMTIAEASVFSEEDIFRVMVREIAVFQNVRYTLIAEIDDRKSSTANTIAVWNNGEYSENFSYPLIGTPCNNVLQGGECFYSSKVQDIFPEDILLKEMGVESYYGSPLINSQGIAIGVMVLLDDKPMLDSTFTRSVLNSFASRAAAEIERQKAQGKIKLNEERLQCFANIMEKETDSLEHFLINAVDEIVSLIKSEIGYLYFYNEETDQFKLHSYSKNIYDKCNLDVCTFFNLEESGVWSQAVKQRKALIINDFKVPHPAKKGFPKGHVDLNRFMTIPVFHLNRIVAVVAVGNKLTDYTPEDIEQLTVLMDSVWKVVEQKKADEKLKLSEEKLKSVLEGAKMGLWELDLESRTISADLHALKMLGLNEHGSNLSAEYFYSLVHPGDANTLRQLIMESAEKCESVSMDFRLRSLSGGWKWVSIKGKPLYINESTTPSSFAGLLSDIDQRIKSEEATLYARIAADDSNRIKKDFIQNVSHELRTPLTAVLGFSDLLLDHDLNDTQQKYATNILQGGNNLLSVVNKMLDFSDTESASNIGKLRITPLSISELVSDIRNLLSTAARKKNIEVMTKNLCSSDNLVADLQKMKRILYNLLENAIKFTEDGGSININISSHENEVIFSVTDNGIGIEATYMDKIFDPFTQVDGSTTRRYGGTGLGLALTKKYVEMQGGSISVESEVGKGSTFTVIIPINSKLQSKSLRNNGSV